MIKLLDKNKNIIGNLTCSLEALVTEERNVLFDLKLQYLIFNPLWDKLQRGNIIECNANDTLKKQMFRIYNVSKPISGKITVYARHISFDLARDIVEEVELTNASCEYALNTLFRNSQFSQNFTGKSDIINAQDFKISNVNILSAIVGVKGSVIDTYGTGAEILRDNTTISVLNKRGHDNGVTIEYSKNMTGLDISLDDSNLITRIKAYAKYTNEANEEVIVNSSPKYVDSPSIDNYETPFIAEIDFSDKFKDKEIPTPEKLKILADKYFLENKCDLIKENIKVEFIPLSKCLGYSDIQDKISLCDTVRIIDSRYNLDTKAKVIKATYNVLTERYEKMELGEPRTSLNDIIGGGNSGGVEIGGDNTNKPPAIGDSNFPNTLPKVSVLSGKSIGLATIELSWTYENKTYYKYELYASKEKDFKPNSFDLIHSGNTSSYLFQAKPNETWYFRVCAVNSHGNRTAFSNQITVTTAKINGEDWIEKATIGQALIGNLSADVITSGKLSGHFMDARNLSVTDGNGKRTLDVDSFGNVNLDVKTLKIGAKDVEETITSISEEINNLEFGSGNFLLNTSFNDSNIAYDTNGDYIVGDGMIQVSNATSFKLDIGTSFGAMRRGDDIALSSIATITSENAITNKVIGGNINIFSEDYDYIVKSVRDLNLNLITVPLVVSFNGATSSEPFVEDYLLNRTKEYLRRLKVAGLIKQDTRLIFEPHPLINGGSISETELNPANRDLFFKNWEAIIVNSLKELSEYKFYGFYIGTNFEKLDRNEDDIQRWITLSNNLRLKYKNTKLIYRTNWWTTAPWDEGLIQAHQNKVNSRIWEVVDIISIAAYFELNDKATPTTDELYNNIINGTSVYNRGQKIFNEVKAFYDKWKKPVMFGELGCPSKEHGAMNPWSNLTSNSDNEDVQANLFEAYNRAFISHNEDLDNSWFMGYSIFTLGTASSEFNVVDKKAGNIISKIVDAISNGAISTVKCAIKSKNGHNVVANLVLPLSSDLNVAHHTFQKLELDGLNGGILEFELNPKSVFKLSKPMLTSGTKTATWSPSPQDMEGYVDSEVNKVNVEITKTNNALAQVDIKAEGIKNTVSKHEQQIISIDGEVKEKITLTQAETIIDQKADNILIQASQSGGGNLIDNSGFASGFSKWEKYEYAWDNKDSTIDIWDDTSEWVLQGTKAIVMICRGYEEIGELGVQQYIKVKQNQTYTISALMARHRCDGGFHVYDADNWEWLGNDTILESEPYNAGKDKNGWKLVKTTFNSGNRTQVGLRYWMSKSSNDGHLWVCQPMMNEGTLSQPWIEKTMDASNVVSSINVSPEAIKIKASKIQLEGTVTAGTGGRQVKVNNGDYSTIIDGQERMFMGSRDFENNYRVPKFYMGAHGFNANEHNYFGMTAYRGNNDNPENNGYAYQDLSYRCINSNFRDWSNIKMYSSGRIRVAPAENFEITTNYLKGVYAGIEERRLALFATSTSPYFNSNLQIGCVRNMTNETGMILADDSVAGAETRVRAHTDSNRQKFFRVCDNVADIGLGSTSFPWKNVVSKTAYVVDNLIVNPTKTSIMTNENALDNIDFIQTMNIDEPIKMDISKIVGSNYAPRITDGESQDTVIDTVELLKLALMEIKKLKEEVKMLKAR